MILPPLVMHVGWQVGASCHEFKPGPNSVMVSCMSSLHLKIDQVFLFFLRVLKQLRRPDQVQGYSGTRLSGHLNKPATFLFGHFLWVLNDVHTLSTTFVPPRVDQP